MLLYGVNNIQTYIIHNTLSDGVSNYLCSFAVPNASIGMIALILRLRSLNFKAQTIKNNMAYN